MATPTGRTNSFWFRAGRAAALFALLVSVAADIEARGGRGGGGGFRGGGIRGGGSTSFGRGGDFGGRGSYNRGSDSYRSGSTFSREGSYSRPSRLDNAPSALDGSGRTNWDAMSRRPSDSSSTRPGSGGSATQLPASRPGGGGSGTQLPANRPGGGGSGTQLPANRPGEGGSGTRWRPDCPKCNDGWDGWIDHPIAAGIVIGAVAGATATIGSAWYSLPADCPPYYWDNDYYYSCDGIWFEPQYEGDTIVYIAVPDPSNGQVTPAS